jgi:hypothetical protein
MFCEKMTESYHEGSTAFCFPLSAVWFLISDF